MLQNAVVWMCGLCEAGVLCSVANVPCILTDFEKLLYRSQSLAQTNFYSNIENIFS